MGQDVDISSPNYEKFLIGDLNSQEASSSVEYFCDIYSFKSPIKESTCYKNPAYPKCIHDTI